jgi:hypothetical protein
VKWLGATVFQYGTVSSINSAALGAPTPKTLTYVPDGIATGVVNGNDVTITVPLTGFGLVAGDKIDHIIAYSMVEHADVTLNDWADQVKSFSYIIGTPAAKQHLADGYVQVSTNNFATSTLATLNSANNTWTASLPVAGSGTVCARQVLAKDLYTPLWDDVQAGPPSCANFSLPTPTKAVSRKIHGGTDTFDVPLPLTGNVGIECRNGQPSAGQHTVVITFPNTISAVGLATCAGQPATATISGKDVTVQCSGVPNSQIISVTINGVNDGVSTGVVTVPMGVLLADVTANGKVTNTDVGAVKAQVDPTKRVTVDNFREDISLNGFVTNTDVGIAKTQVNPTGGLSPAP